MPLTEPAAAAPKFHRLRVADLRRETADTVSLSFAVPPALAGAYRFAPGQYLTLRATIAGEELRRSYSICTVPEDGELRIAVRRVDGGRFSTWVNEALRPGDPVDVMTPTGRFGAAALADPAGLHVAFCAGSGITPVLPVARAVLAASPASRFHLFYGNRTGADALFRAELAALKDRHLGRVSVLHVLSREEQDLPVLNGRLDGARVRRLLPAMVPPAEIAHAHVCGPATMIDEVAGVLAEFGLPPARLHTERFVSAEGGRPRPRPPVAPGAPSAHRAAIILDGKRREVPVAEGETILDAALRAGLDMPFACKGGMCSTCRARLADGEADMAVNYALEPWETAAGFILTCQSRPRTPRVTVDFDAM